MSVYQAVEVRFSHLWSWPGHCPATGHHHQSSSLVWIWPPASICAPHLDFGGFNIQKRHITPSPLCQQFQLKIIVYVNTSSMMAAAVTHVRLGEFRLQPYCINKEAKINTKVMSRVYWFAKFYFT